MFDTALSKGIQSFIEEIKTLYPGIFVYSVQIPEDGSLDDERKAGWVCLTLSGYDEIVLDRGKGRADCGHSGEMQMLKARQLVIRSQPYQSSQMAYALFITMRDQAADQFLV